MSRSTRRAGWLWYILILIGPPVLILLGIALQPGLLANFYGFTSRMLVIYPIYFLLPFPGGYLVRSQRQNLFMQALQDKIISAGILPKVSDMVQEFDKMIVTDLSPKQLVSLACIAKATPKSSITFHQIDGDLVTLGSNGLLIPNVNQIEAKLTEWLGQ